MGTVLVLQKTGNVFTAAGNVFTRAFSQGRSAEYQRGISAVLLKYSHVPPDVSGDRVFAQREHNLIDLLVVSPCLPLGHHLNDPLLTPR